MVSLDLGWQVTVKGSIPGTGGVNGSYRVERDCCGTLKIDDIDLKNRNKFMAKKHFVDDLHFVPGAGYDTCPFGQ